MALTQIENLINPEVMADMISAKVEKKLVVTPFAKIDTSLSGVPGDTIKVPKYAYIGDAEDVAEGIEAGTVTLTATVAEAKIKKAMKAIELTDEALLSGYGNPVGEANNQLALSIAAKVDADALDALLTATLSHDGTAAQISYAGIVDAISLLEEEVNCKKVIFVHPLQLPALRKDKDYVSAEKTKEAVLVRGQVGEIAGCKVVPSRRVTLDETGSYYINPIIKIEEDKDTEDETPALTVYLKRDTNVEQERHTLKRSTDISADKFYTVALSNDSKVVLAKFKK